MPPMAMAGPTVGCMEWATVLPGRALGTTGGMARRVWDPTMATACTGMLLSILRSLTGQDMAMAGCRPITHPCPHSMPRFHLLLVLTWSGDRSIETGLDGQD